MSQFFDIWSRTSLGLRKSIVLSSLGEGSLRDNGFCVLDDFPCIHLLKKQTEKVIF